MSIKFFGIILFGIFFVLTESSLADPSDRNLLNPRLTLVGEFGNKKYYSEPGPYDWEGGEANCEASGMTLIAVETLEENSYLGQVMTGPEGNKYYWTSGIEPFYKFTEYFEWSNNGKKVQNVGGFQAFKSGIAFYPAGFPTSVGYLTMKSYPISTQFPILCQNITTSSLIVKSRKMDPKDSVKLPHQQ